LSRGLSRGRRKKKNYPMMSSTEGVLGSAYICGCTYPDS
jgi:hypothetical protein